MTIKALPTTVIRPSGAGFTLDLRELWSYRDLLEILAGRDVRLRYKQTALGVVWVVLQPVLAAVIFALLFGRLAHLPSDGAPYLLFVFCGLVSWNLFSGTLQRAGSSLIGDARLITKVYFPRLLIPLASTGAVLVDFAVTMTVLAVLMPLYRITPSWHLVTLPAFFALTLVGSIGFALWLAALNVRYRDFVYVLPFVLQIWLLATPVGYAGKLVPGAWRWLYEFNPAVGYVEGFRWAILGSSSLRASTILISAGVSVAALLSGVAFFRRVERGFADIV